MKQKRFRRVYAKDGELVCKYGFDPAMGKDLYYANGLNTSRTDSRILCSALEGLMIFEGQNLRNELEKRGYDITTLKFSIKKLPKED